MAGAFHREARIDGGRGVVGIFDLGLGQRSLFNRRPHHGLGTPIQAAIHQDPAKFTSDGCFSLIGHSGVGVMPVAKNTKALKFLGLHTKPVGGKIPAFLAEFFDRNFVLILALLAVLFFDLPFNRQAMTVPAGNIVGVLAKHGLRPVDHVLENLVQRVPNVKLAIGIGRAVMENKRLGIGTGFAETAIDINLLPASQNLRLFFRQPSPHREVGLWQEHCLFIVHHKLSRFVLSPASGEAIQIRQSAGSGEEGSVQHGRLWQSGR